MSEQNLAAVRKSTELWNAHDAKGVAALLSEDYVLESDTLPAPVRGRKATADMVQMYLNAFPDLHLDIESLHAAGNLVISRWRCVGTQRGDLQGIPPTNKKSEIHGCTVSEFNEGKVIREWVYWDRAKMLENLGVLPASGKGAKTS
jgi:steroid delta-isomerase-like uncharacterized protein